MKWWLLHEQSFFRPTKPKKADSAHHPSLSERELHKRDLDARREKDFEKMKEEKERYHQVLLRIDDTWFNLFA